ncbi:MAG: alpha/beta hydrolase, partial [Pseudomonadota bacterium]
GPVHKVTVGEGAPAVLVHCSLSHHRGLLPLAKALGGQATLFDMPGHGRSPAWNGEGDYQAAVVAAIADCCAGPVDLIGHSFGGTAALRFATQQPGMVKTLTLIEPVYFAAAKGTPAYADLAQAMVPFIAAMKANDPLTATQVFNGLWGGGPWDSLPTRIQDYMTDRIALIVAGAKAIEDDPTSVTSAATLGQLDVPVTLIRGAQSHPVVAAIHAALSARLPNAKDHLIENAGHMVPITHPEDVAAIIRAAGPETA